MKRYKKHGMVSGVKWGMMREMTTSVREREQNEQREGAVGKWGTDPWVDEVRADSAGFSR